LTKHGSFHLVPTLDALFQVGSDVGGDNQEFRDQNRARFYLEPGLFLSYSQVGWAAGAGLSLYSEQDYHSYGEAGSERRGITYLGEGYAYVFLRDSGIVRNPAHPRAPDEAGFLFLAGRTYLEYDPEGLLFKGNSPLLELRRQGRLKGIDLTFYVRHQLVHRADKPLHLEQNTGRFSNAGIKICRGPLSREVLYGFYRASGRAATANTYLVGDIILTRGQGARSDRDGHYYSLGFSGVSG
jgi:hypothetical protein